MKHAWFKKIGWCHYPVSWQGYVILLIALLFIMSVFLAVDRASHSISETFYNMFPFVVCTAVILEWIAERQKA